MTSSLRKTEFDLESCGHYHSSRGGSGGIFLGSPPLSSWVTCGYNDVPAPATTRISAPGQEAEAPPPTRMGGGGDPLTASCSPDMGGDICGCWFQPLPEASDGPPPSTHVLGKIQSHVSNFLLPLAVTLLAGFLAFPVA